MPVSPRDPRRSRLVLGAAQLGMAYGIANRDGAPSTEAALALLRRADEAGLGGVDTAPAYGRSEELIGEAGVQLAVTSKVGGEDPATAVGATLARLRRSRLDVLLLHWPDALGTDAGRADLARAADLVGDLVDAVGVSVYTPEEFERALGHQEVSVIQAPLSIADRRLVTSGLLAAARAADVRVQARSAYLQGALLLDAEELPAHLVPLAGTLGELDRGAATAGTTRQELLLRWTLAQDVDAVIVGVESLDQLERNIAAADAGPLAVEEPDVADLPAEVLDPRTWPARSAG